MEEWTAKLKTLSDEELMELQALLTNELRARPTELPADDRQWKRCPICDGTGKHAGGYCRCAMGRDIRIVELGSTSSYELPRRWDDV
jgi:hypothetical protein